MVTNTQTGCDRRNPIHPSKIALTRRICDRSEWLLESHLPMDVLLDTNAVLANSVDSTPFKALRKYLRKTRSRLLLPSVVVEELCAERQRQIRKLERDLEAVHKDFRRLFPAMTLKYPGWTSTNLWGLTASNSLAALRTSKFCRTNLMT